MIAAGAEVTSFPLFFLAEGADFAYRTYGAMNLKLSYVDILRTCTHSVLFDRSTLLDSKHRKRGGL